LTAPSWHAQVIRHNFTKRNLLHPEWYPPDFTKWAVPFEVSALHRPSAPTAPFRTLARHFARAHATPLTARTTPLTARADARQALATTSLVDGLYYPPYCSGGGYMLGASAARTVVSAHDARMANQQPVVRVEDAYVGLLAAEVRDALPCFVDR
jgi:hypothetical protein